jgi:hypothetical protein
LRKFVIIIPAIVFWAIIAISLVVFAGIGISMLYFLLSYIIFAVIIRNPAILERVRGEKYTEEQRAHLSEITNSNNYRILFIGILVIFVILTVILLFNNYRMIDFIGN